MHGGGSSLDFHENFAQAPQYRGECKCSISSFKAPPSDV